MNRYLLLIALTLLVGCLKTRADLAAEEADRSQQKQTVSQQREIARDQSNAQDTVKAPPPAADDYDEQMRQLNGRVDNLENQVTQMNANKQADKDSVDKEKAAITQKFTDYETALKKMEAEIAALNDEITRLKNPPPPPVVEKAEEAPAAKAKTANEVGDEQFAAKKWKEAIVSYQKYRDTSPKGRKFAEVTYKIGVCFQELGMKDEAKAFYEEVSAKFPGSKEAKKANQRAKTLR